MSSLSLADYCEVNWNAEFVHAYEAAETRKRQQEQRQSYWQDHGHGPFGGTAQDPREFFQQVRGRGSAWLYDLRFGGRLWVEGALSGCCAAAAMRAALLHQKHLFVVKNWS